MVSAQFASIVPTAKVYGSTQTSIIGGLYTGIYKLDAVLTLTSRASPSGIRSLQYFLRMPLAVLELTHPQELALPKAIIKFKRKR